MVVEQAESVTRTVSSVGVIGLEPICPFIGWVPSCVPVGILIQVTSLVVILVIVQVPAGVASPIPSLKSAGSVLFGGRIKVQVVVLFTVTVPGVPPTPHVTVRPGMSEVTKGEVEKFIVAGEVDVVWLSPARETFGRVTVELVGDTGLVILYWM